MSKTTTRINGMNIGIFIVFFGISICSAIFLMAGTISLLFFNLDFVISFVQYILDPFHKWLTETGMLLFYGVLFLDLSLIFQLKYKIFLFEDVSEWWKGELK